MKTKETITKNGKTFKKTDMKVVLGASQDTNETYTFVIYKTIEADEDAHCESIEKLDGKHDNDGHRYTIDNPHAPVFCWKHFEEHSIRITK